MTRFSFGRRVRWAVAAALILSAALFFGCKLPWLANPPAMPTGVIASDGTFTDKVRIVWSSVDGAQGYQVYRAPSETGQYEKIGETAGTAYDDSGITPNVVYWYKVRACNAAGCSVLSAADSGYAEPVIPDAPSGVSASDGTYDDRIRIDWNPVSGAANYEIWRGTSQGGTYSKVGETNSPPYDDTTVTVGTTYWYRVKACSAAGCSPLSASDSGYAQTGGGGGDGDGDTSPARPGGVSATDGTYEDKVHISWNAVSGAESYQVFYSTAEGGTYTQIAETSGTSYDDLDDISPLDPCVSYWYKVRACNAAGCSDLSDADEGWRETRVTGVPSNVAASDGTYSDKILITWDAVTGADIYHIYRSTSYSGGYTEIDQTASTTYYDTTATPEVTYWYKIMGCSEYATCDACGGCSGGCGGYSIPESGYRSCLPPAPENVSASDTDTAKITVTWDAVNMPTGYEVTRYEIYRSDTETGTYTKIGEVGGTTTLYEDATAEQGDTYWYKVKACNDCGCGPLSTADSGTRPNP